MSTPTTLESVRSPLPREANMPAVAPGFGSLQSFELMQRAANLLASSTLVPAAYRKVIEKLDKYGNVKESRENPNALANAVVALNMAQRMGADPLMVMQNLYIVEGRPSWSSQWIIAAVNGCGRFSPLRFDIKVLGDKTVERVETVWENGNRSTVTKRVPIVDKVCVAWAIEKETGERIESPAVSIEMAVKEGWYTKNGSKWQTMDEVMLRYRTASFFGKLYAPELLMGLTSVEEVADIVDVHEDGSYSLNRSTLDELRAGRAQPAEEVSRATPAQTGPATESRENAAPPSDAHADPVDDQGEPGDDDDDGQGGFDFDVSGLVLGIREDIETAKTPEDLDLARSAIAGVPDETAKAELNALASARMRAITAAAEQATGGKTTAQTTAPAGRRPRNPINAD
ncbi:hypothetical protein WR30_11025 [Burkholderia contaminans FFH2055]|uniref:hypothetical protein n=1 Tax=Burkholderia contaminans TaxID=488447 RepID=UPI0006254B41|nr:hypothetical protein [Burkholderia contaminans]KKL38586.1 hypothetical protein WR30_11025 [Burkholderia contaminans FFH2055]MEB4631127.1 hypothetical protein [Burkholderia contaminans]MEB4638025.1 hypothetical protein [Burkholderia contaminans]MEB4653109.1 hypothetical protein [Burkholderia contaminans]MEB4658145.1 hypothetical protein [Burkholderia contaminans]